MDIESPNFERWEAEFTQLAETVPLAVNKQLLASANMHLTLYGDNALSEEQEFLELEKMKLLKDQLQKVVVDTDFWQNIYLFY